MGRGRYNHSILSVMFVNHPHYVNNLPIVFDILLSSFIITYNFHTNLC